MAFKKGQSGNPGGINPSKPVHDALKRASAQDPKRVRAMVESILTLASGGERWACEFVRDTLDGKPAQAITGAGDNGEHIYELKAPWMESVARERGWV